MVIKTKLVLAKAVYAIATDHTQNKYFCYLKRATRSCRTTPAFDVIDNEAKFYWSNFEECTFRLSIVHHALGLTLIGLLTTNKAQTDMDQFNIILSSKT